MLLRIFSSKFDYISYGITSFFYALQFITAMRKFISSFDEG